MKGAVKKNFAVLFLLFPFYISAESEEKTIEFANSPVLPEKEQLYYLEDTDASLQIYDIASPGRSDSYVPVKHVPPNFGYKRSAFWFRFTIHNASNTARPLLEVDLPTMHSLILYSPDGAQFREYKSGQTVPYSERAIRHRIYFLPLDISPGETKTFYLRVYSENTVAIPFRILSPQDALASSGIEDLVLGLYFGFCLLIIINNIFLYTTDRSRDFIYYILFVCSLVVYMATQTGITGAYLLGELPYASKRSLPVFVSLSSFFGALFAISFLKTAKLTPRLHLILIGLTLAAGLNALASTFAPHYIVIRVALFTVLFFSPMAILVAFLCFRRGNRQAMFFLISWPVFLAATIIYALRSLGILPNNMYTHYSVHFGSAFQMSLLSLGLADRIRLLNQKLNSLMEFQKKRAFRLEEMLTKTGQVSADLVEISGQQSEIGAHFRKMAGSRAEISSDISAAFEELAAAADTVQQSMRGLAAEGRKAGEMAEFLKKSQDDVEGARAQVQANIDKIVASTGSSVEYLRVMDEKIRIINEGGKAVHSIISVIDGITERTNLLSLNASIEAARAGEHGRGFGVVADEIGKLADATAKNSREITNQINRILADMADGMKTVALAKQSIEEIKGRLEGIGNEMNNVRRSIENHSMAVGHLYSQAELLDRSSRDIVHTADEQKTSLEKNSRVVLALSEMSGEIEKTSARILEFTGNILERAQELKYLTSRQSIDQPESEGES